LVLSRAPAAAVDILAEDLSSAGSSLSGVTGPATEAERFAGLWIARHGGRWTTRVRLRLHELTQLSTATRIAPGALRKATANDLPLAGEWLDGYVRDTGIQSSAGIAQRLIDRGQLFLWIDGGAARSMVAATRETNAGCSINSVYTPPVFRRHGYATTAVATLSRRILEGGRRFCCLYTDAANPTSNSIYAKIGYKPIRDDVEIAFEP
jgi:predicted GNAT family acetyltransferase